MTKKVIDLGVRRDPCRLGILLQEFQGFPISDSTAEADPPGASDLRPPPRRARPGQVCGGARRLVVRRAPEGWAGLLCRQAPGASARLGFMGPVRRRQNSGVG